VACYVVDCDASYDPISLAINGHIYNITSDQLTMDIGLGGNQCLCALWNGADFGLDALGVDWALGAPFLRAYCLTTDVGNDRMGLASVGKGGGRHNTAM